jgi:2-oxoglutarate ferredoxin oxidoreductase subunit delta
MNDSSRDNVQKLPVRITINEKWCKKCGICITFCPKKVLVPDDQGKPVVQNPEKCIQCMLCEIHCPDFAIEVEEKKKDLP